ncbi:MAG: MarR family transcriptional regulator [Clostridia bacterium]|nr:MarR family transcriptional regulator [Clostridia bacterium]
MSSKYERLRLKNQLCFPLYAASREVTKKYRPYLEALDLTYTQYIAMMVFWEDKKLNVKELGRKLMLDCGTLSPVLKSLEAKGYISRTRSRSDERALDLVITEKGEALADRAVEIPESVAGCISIEAEEAAELYRILYKILSKGEDVNDK